MTEAVSATRGTLAQTVTSVSTAALLDATLGQIGTGICASTLYSHSHILGLYMSSVPSNIFLGEHQKLKRQGKEEKEKMGGESEECGGKRRGGEGRDRLEEWNSGKIWERCTDIAVF